jgi:uncharacterized protein YndB with AHSA1/START domain
VTDPGPAAGDVRVTHVFDAAPDAVFAAWTDPEQVARWWAPDGFEIPPESVEIDARVGGRFHLTMVDASTGERFRYHAEFIEISEPERIVLKADGIPDAGIEETITRVVLEPDGRGTRMTITSGPFTEEGRRNAEAGWFDLVANLERLLAAA